MRTEGAVKQEQILEAAIRRFSHFGISKTTLSEVADDLSLSKQSLLYYFPDKSGLVAAVEEKITEDYLTGLNLACREAPSTEAAFQKLIEVKIAFFQKYFMLVNQLRTSDVTATGRSMADVKRGLREREITLLAQLLHRGIASGELKTMDAERTAGILLDTLTAFSYCISEKKGLPQPEDFRWMDRKQKEVLGLFYNGLKLQA